MVSSVIKSSSIKFIYEDQDNNYWKFYVDKNQFLDKHGHLRDSSKRYLELKVPVPEMGVVTQQYEVDNEMVRELIEWLCHSNNE